MSLRILVIGREAPGRMRDVNNHHFSFRGSALSDNKIINVDEFDFVFQHLGPGNEEAAAAIKWWIARDLGSRVVGFRGGAISNEWNAQKIALLEDAEDIMAFPWALVPQEFSGDAAELVRLLQPESLDVLPAIAILCQGYLAVYASHHQEIQSDSIGDALVEMGWDYQKHSSLVCENEANVQAASWWLDVFELRADSTGATQAADVDPARWSDFVARLATEWGNGHEKLLNGSFMRVLREGRTLSDPGLVAEAYLEIARRLGDRRRN